MQSAFCNQQSCPFMITYFFGMKIWGLNILAQEGTEINLFSFKSSYEKVINDFPVRLILSPILSCCSLLLISCLCFNVTLQVTPINNSNEELNCIHIYVLFLFIYYLTLECSCLGISHELPLK